MKTLKSSIYTTLLALMLSSNSYADCSFELFSISSTKGTKIIDFVEQLSDECELTIIISDPNAEEFLNRPLNKTHLKNLTINEVFDIILNENDLTYTLEGNLLRISYLSTKVFAIDYILSQRSSQGSTDITLSSSAIEEGSSTSGLDNIIQEDGAGGRSDSQTESGIKIQSTDEVVFWSKLDLEFQAILNRPHDIYKAKIPLINKNAGLVTVTATIKQMKRFEEYLARMQKKVQLQVLIDVKLLLVTMSNKETTGVDWSQLYALQNLQYSLSADRSIAKNRSYLPQEGQQVFIDPVSKKPELVGAILPAGMLDSKSVNSVNQGLIASTSGEIKEVIKFLKTQGDVTTLSNPKILTLNNQPALITVGTEFFYKLKNTETLSNGAGGTQSQKELIKSVFSGILLDITPEISENNIITLKINPSISEINGPIPIDSITGEATMPPNLDRRQLSSVITVEDGKRIVLGGLIKKGERINVNKVPLLGDIPLLGYAFKYEDKVKTTQELIMIIQPHIISKHKDSSISLKELGYKGVLNTEFGGALN